LIEVVDAKTGNNTNLLSGTQAKKLIYGVEGVTIRFGVTQTLAFV